MSVQARRVRYEVTKVRALPNSEGLACCEQKPQKGLVGSVLPLAVVIAAEKRLTRLDDRVLRPALPGRCPLGFEFSEDFFAKGGRFRGWFGAHGDAEVSSLGEVSRHPLGRASHQLRAQVALDLCLGLVNRSLCDCSQLQEGWPTLETIGLAMKVEGGLLAHDVVLLFAVCCGCCVRQVCCVLCVPWSFEFRRGPALVLRGIRGHRD